MLGRSKYLFIKFFYITIDFVCLYFAIFSSCSIRQNLLAFPITFTGLLIDPYNPYRFLFLLWIVMTIFLLNSNSLYETRREVLEGIEIWLVIKSVFFASLLTIAAIYALKIQGFPRTVFMNTTIAMMVLLSLWRVVKRWLVEYLVAHGYNNFNVLIVGAGKVGLLLAEEIKKRPGLGIKIIGFLDDYKSGVPGKNEPAICGKISDFPVLARREFINKIFITIHPDNGSFMKLLEEARDLGIAVRVVPQGYDLTTGDFFKYSIGIIPILEYRDAQNLRQQAGKRLFDFVVSLLTLLMISPFFIIIGILIKMDSPGPIFYVSKRYGRGGRIFRMYKFRSMIPEAEAVLSQLREKNEVDGPIFKMKEDPRVTPLGKFLRRYSLDELPQIFNVLKGDMSFVGPRPLPIDQIEKQDLRQLARLEVRPGITGLWQIRGRSNISFSRLVKWDVWYINNWSFWLDLNIFVQTVPVVLKGKGAY